MRKDYNIVHIMLSDNWFKKGDIIEGQSPLRLLVLRDPIRTKWKLFLQAVSFGLYKISKDYKCKILNN